MDDRDCYSNDSYGPPSSCLDLTNDSVLEIFSALAPNCKRGAWTPISVPWKVFFYFHLIFFGILFLVLGILCIVLMMKRHSAQRFKAKTFIAIDISIAILGFSRFLFYIIDPFGISGFCTELGCVIVSRLLFALGFPSLTAAYTLVFITLWYSAKMRLGRSCIQHWRIIIPLCFIHYFVAIVFELIGAFGTYPVVFLLLACEAIFTVWGLFVCITFLIAGCRLLQTIKVSIHQSSVVSRDRASVSEMKSLSSGNTSIVGRASRKGTLNNTADSETYSVTRMKLHVKKHHKQAIRKITIITYIAATLGGLYSVLTLIQLVMVSLQLFGECPEEDSNTYHSNSDMWLGLKYIGTVIEYLLAILLLYSINDVRPLVKAIRTCLCPKKPNAQDKGKQQARKYFTYSYEETTDANGDKHFTKKLTKKLTSVRFSEDTANPPMSSPPASPTATENSLIVTTNTTKMDNTVKNGVTIPTDEGDMDSRTSVSHTEVNVTTTALSTDSPISHSDVIITTVDSPISHSEVNVTTPDSPVSHTEANLPIADSPISHSDVNVTTPDSLVSHSDVNLPTADSPISHSNVNVTTADSPVSHSEVNVTTADSPV